MQQDPVLAVGLLISNWAKTNIAKIHAAFSMRGGWEGWAQVEIAYLCMANQIPVGREQAIFQNDPTRRADLCLGNPPFAIEMKCETSATPDIFLAIDGDLTKIYEDDPSCPAGVLAFGQLRSLRKAANITQSLSFGFQPVRSMVVPLQLEYGMAVFVI